ncbi:MAG TPA: hypothetical protein VHH92_03480 [Actinomycetota bacterium]|nr:hypothetical protein [Actinomycetota bacterium]
MSEIAVTPLEDGAFGVRVTEGDLNTDHRVTVPDDLLDDLGLADADRETVVREAFGFLLEREPATSILPEFSLDQIGRYFPEFTTELPRRLTG